MSKSIRGRSADTIFVLIVFSVFAFSVLMVLMLGAGVYRNVNDISNEGQHEHTALSYIWTKTRNFDTAGSIHVGEFDGVSALFIDEVIGGTDFRTVIYAHNGWLIELFSETALEFSLGDGIRIMQIDDMHFANADHGLIEVTTGEKRLFLSLRSGLERIY